MFSLKLGHNRFYGELTRDIRRGVSKMSTNKNSYATSTAHDHKISDNNVNYTKWMKQTQQNNNIRAFATFKQTLIEPQEFTDFKALFPEIIEELTIEKSQELPDVMRRLDRMLQHTTLNGKKMTMMLISSYKLLEDPQKLTPENIKLVTILGWCLEMLQSQIMLYDDIIDQSETRRGLPCWYCLPDIGLSGINDGLMLENIIYVLLKKHLGDHPAYIPITELFQEAFYQTTIAQSYDVMFVGPNGKPNLEFFTKERYASLAITKGYYCFFQPPTFAAMYLAGIYDEEQKRQSKAMLMKLATFCQVQNDFFDSFSDPAVIGKLGTDIKMGRCTWFAVMALEKATPAQRKIIQEHYGRSEPESVENIRQLYNDLCFSDMFYAYKEETFNDLRTHIQQKGLREDIFLPILKMMFKYNK